MRLLALGLALAMACSGAIITYEGRDAGVGPGGARPNSDLAQSNFLAAVAAATPFTLDFESIPVQYSNSINLTTMTLFQVGTANESNAGVTDVPGDATLGYNTTSGGSHFLRIVPQFGIGTAGARLVFNSPVEFFGAYFTGLGTAAGSLTVEFDNGDPAGPFAYPVVGGDGGGVNFFGFTTFGAPITEVTMVLRGVTADSRDIYSIDDITTGLEGRYVGDVPEPSTYMLLASGLAGFAFLRRKRA